ncbi:unnamed protein product [Polarella glacialis]|uniref:Uncharacterized protein n=1 Tax=Polarella glacialis TaxID=89957 RepID=A0A813KS24_POLGL|nr:unnamed protein product [Polarella glacialis]
MACTRAPLDLGMFAAVVFVVLLCGATGLPSLEVLTGPIPGELAQLKNIQSLWLDENQLTGAIRGELGQSKSLEKLWLHLVASRQPRCHRCAPSRLFDVLRAVEVVAHLVRSAVALPIDGICHGCHCALQPDRFKRTMWATAAALFILDLTFIGSIKLLPVVVTVVVVAVVVVTVVVIKSA